MDMFLGLALSVTQFHARIAVSRHSCAKSAYAGISRYDTAASVINAGYANSAKLDPNLAIAKEDNTSPYVNIIAAREEDKDNPTYVKFVKIFQTDAVKNYINEKAKGALVPAW